ncbi:MAG: phage tail protein [Halobacteriota archaeon]
MEGSIAGHPYAGFRFLVEIDGLLVGGFSDVSGLEVEIETEDVHEGGVNDSVHTLPRVVKHPHLVLKRGIADATALWDWMDDAAQGVISLRTVRVILIDADGREAWHWVCDSAYPVKWTGPELKASSNAVAMETLELVYRRFLKA